jgi:hypothetical protein
MVLAGRPRRTRGAGAHGVTRSTCADTGRLAVTAIAALAQMRSGQTQRSLRSPLRMVEAVGIDDGFDTFGKSDALSVRFKASAMPASEKGDGATGLPHVRKPRSVSTFQRTDPLTGVAVNHVMDRALSSAPINSGYLDVHRVGPHRLGMMAIER